MVPWQHGQPVHRDDYDHNILLYYHFFDGHDRDDSTLVGVRSRRLGFGLGPIPLFFGGGRKSWLVTLHWVIETIVEH
jgi:hypothetical protein